MPTSHRARLGQHFLADRRFQNRIAGLLDLRPGEPVVEIGPGRGAMTALLAERADRVIGIEFDRGLARGLRQTFAANPRVEILEADILRTDLRSLLLERGAAQCFMFGNLPYYITSPILHHVLRFADSIRAMGLMVQREVAARIEAQPGSRDYGYLSVFVQAHADPQILLDIPPGAFSPRPRVHSSLVLFQMHAKDGRQPEARQEEFLKFVQRCFAQKRKKLVNNLLPFVPRGAVKETLTALSIPENARAEDLTLAQFHALFDGLQ
jgi:16S rRNA (adenine1518-N6/adenine1519-N6)-dimethyltransferase